MFRSTFDVPAEDLFRWHERSEALDDLLPGGVARVVERSGGIQDGGRVVLRLGLGPLSVTWEALHDGYVAGEQFRDTQVRGPFRVWRHTHRVLPAGPERRVLEDRIEFALPGGAVGRTIGVPLVRAMLRRAFAQRHATTRESLSRMRGTEES